MKISIKSAFINPYILCILFENSLANLNLWFTEIGCIVVIDRKVSHE